MRAIRSTLLTLVAAAFASAALAAGPVYRIEVDGLACPFCAYGIERELDRIEGVQGVETDIEAGAVMVTMAPGRTLEQSRAREAVAKAGFTLAGFQEIDPGTDGEAQ